SADVPTPRRLDCLARQHSATDEGAFVLSQSTEDLPDEDLCGVVGISLDLRLGHGADRRAIGPKARHEEFLQNQIPSKPVEAIHEQTVGLPTLEARNGAHQPGSVL